MDQIYCRIAAPFQLDQTFAVESSHPSSWIRHLLSNRRILPVGSDIYCRIVASFQLDQTFTVESSHPSSWIRHLLSNRRILLADQSHLLSIRRHCSYPSCDSKESTSFASELYCAKELEDVGTVSVLFSFRLMTISCKKTAWYNFCDVPATLLQYFTP
ncbi:unnamed protein product [Larinioides sclopetarius]|uniref:Uncharacterized protein n=1 Tax=Larinioides sclopetarius TaxID=280406 RepID=A0AAV2BBH1_9ARAC